jgi:hypothetical protein
MPETTELTPQLKYRHERDFTNHWAKVAQECGWMVYHTYDSRHSPKGFPDLICLKDGRMIVAELKMKKYKRGVMKGDPMGVTPDQRAWLSEFDSLVGDIAVYIWTPDDEEEMSEALS